MKVAASWVGISSRHLATLLAAVALSLAFGGRALAAPTGDALTAARFSITIDGYEIASFSELQGISTSAQLPLGTTTPSKAMAVVLRRGMTSSMEMWAWHEAVLIGDIAAARKSAALTIYSYDGKPVARYHLENAWPSKIEVAALKAGSSEVLMETVTIVCEHIQRVPV